ncbi:MAG: PAS domain S-box protein [Deltaproteobacteria bacterium]|nr:PAS domain S-box protein [Deltaproteobacteria bacterium]
MIETILFISVALQVVAAFLALRLIRITEVRAAWILMATGLVLMAVGRIIDVLPFFSIEITPEINLLNELVDVIISFVMIAGVALIAPLFYAIRQSEKALRESEERYRTLVDNVNVGVYRSTGDIEGRYLQVNPAMAKIFGYESIEDFMHISISELYREPEGRKRFIGKIREAGYVRNEILELRKRDGTPIKASVTATVQYDEHGDVKWIDGVTEDITEQKLAEDKLRESEQMLHRVIQSSPIPAFVIGKDHRVIYWNRALEELSGINAEEVIGTTHYWRAFYSKERPCMADLLVDQSLEAIPQWYFEKYLKSRLLDDAYEATDFFPELGDTGKWLRFTAAVIRDSQGYLVGAIETLEDVTERKRAEEELIRVRKLESLEIFAGGIAHDFNNLLSVMLRNIFLAKLSLADEKEELTEGLEIAEKVGLQAKELAHRLITFAKGGDPIRKIGSITQLMKNSADLSLSGSNVRCDFSMSDNIWPVEMDDVQIRQVIHNLVINARESMPDGGAITIHAENVTVSSGNGLPLKEGKYVKWAVKDHGVGIAKEDLQRIFDPYFTTKPTGSARGMGLGLAICYSIIKKHDGSITVESEPGVGSTFYVYLPATPREDPVSKTETDFSFLRGGKILVMDDDDTVRHSTGIVLNFLGYDVEYSKDGDEAVDLYRKALEMNQPYSAVILDLNIPRGKGAKETIRELLLIDPHVIAILSSGYTDDPEVMEFSKDGFRGIITVPYDVGRLKKVLNTLLG